MRIHTILAAAAITASLAGCYTYPVYQPAPVARLTPAQVTAITNGQPLSQADRDQIARDNAQVRQQDQAAQAYSYAPVVPAYAAPAPYYYDPYYAYGYPYFGGFYPGVSLSLGFRGYYGHGWGGGGYRGGYGGFHGRH